MKMGTTRSPWRYDAILQSTTTRLITGRRRHGYSDAVTVALCCTDHHGEVIAASGTRARHLEDALALADEIEDGNTGYLIERALDEARSRQFRPIR
jgi:hypothetical protein